MDSLGADLDVVIGLRVFFGHQSVGGNILDGLRELLREHRRDWPIVEHRGPSAPSKVSGGPSPALLHAKLGRNEHPLTKCDHFRRVIDEELGDQVDVAVLKFCYIDVDTRTDVAMLFDRYRAALQDLSDRHPSTTFVPVTVPLSHAQGGVGVWVREVLGRPNQAKLKNLARHAFNERLRENWTGSPLFDLAASEATRPDGRRERFSYRGRTAENLVRAYTDDGGHLNETGRRVVAADFVRTLSRAVRRCA